MRYSRSAGRKSTLGKSRPSATCPKNTDLPPQRNTTVPLSIADGRHGKSLTFLLPATLYIRSTPIYMPDKPESSGYKPIFGVELPKDKTKRPIPKWVPVALVSPISSWISVHVIQDHDS